MRRKHHIKSRLDCVKTKFQRDKDYFKKVFWSDESKIELFGHNDATHVWREDGAAYSQQSTIPTMKHGSGNIMVCGCFAYSETEELRNIDSTMKSAKYIKIFRRLLAFICSESRTRPDKLFQQVNDPKQTAKETCAWFEDNNIKVMKRPGQYPDMNPRENVWKLLKKRIR